MSDADDDGRSTNNKYFQYTLKVNNSLTAIVTLKPSIHQEIQFITISIQILNMILVSNLFKSQLLVGCRKLNTTNLYQNIIHCLINNI